MHRYRGAYSRATLSNFTVPKAALIRGGSLFTFQFQRRRLFEGSTYSRAAPIRVNTVIAILNSIRSRPTVRVFSRILNFPWTYVLGFCSFLNLLALGIRFFRFLMLKYTCVRKMLKLQLEFIII